MKFACSLLLLAVASSAAALDCKDVKSLTNLNITQLRGKWNVVEVLQFKDGAPIDKPLSVVPISSEGPKAPRCIKTKVKVNNETSVCMKAKFFLSEDERMTKRSTFTLAAPDNGRWELQSTVPYRQNNEVLVLATDTDKYLVLLMCAPEAGRPSTDRSPVRIAFMSRQPKREVTDATRTTEDRDFDDEDDEVATSEARGLGDKRANGNYIPVTEDELKIVRSDVAKLIGVPSINPGKLDIDCFFHDKKGGKKDKETVPQP